MARDAGTTVVSSGLPSVSVPVLSTTSVSTFSSVSSASAFLISTPACAPRPVPTMIDIGVARPSAHGHAMISTATALTSVGEARLRAEERPDDEREDRDRDDRRHEPGRDHVGQSAGSARERCASATICDDLREQRVAPTRSARITKLPVPLTVPPVTGRPPSSRPGSARR